MNMTNDSCYCFIYLIDFQHHEIVLAYLLKKVVQSKYYHCLDVYFMIEEFSFTKDFIEIGFRI